jgi:hypothetical protein
MLVHILLAAAVTSGASVRNAREFASSGLLELLRERDGARPKGKNLAKFPGDEDAAPMGFKDHNGHQCDICGKPLASRLPPGKKYKEFRTDCGKSARNIKNYLMKPLYSFTKSAEETENGLPTNAFCELNMQKTCNDAIANRDYMYYAKSIRGLEQSPAKKYDWSYCQQNGWLEKDIVDLAHSGNFEAMRKRADDDCNGKYMKYNWKKITLGSMAARYIPGIAFRGHATHYEANFLGGWNCAMGDAACDMTYCAYSYCDLGDGKARLYSECPGWDPVKGNRK